MVSSSALQPIDDFLTAVQSEPASRREPSHDARMRVSGGLMSLFSETWSRMSCQQRADFTTLAIPLFTEMDAPEIGEAR